MSRTLALLIALLFVGLPQASLLCKAWCEPVAAVVATGCHRQDSGTGAAVEGVDGCSVMVVSEAALLTHQLRPGASVRGTLDRPASVVYQVFSNLIAGIYAPEPPGSTQLRSPRVRILRI